LSSFLSDLGWNRAMILFWPQVWSNSRTVMCLLSREICHLSAVNPINIQVKKLTSLMVFKRNC
jgi:hypothetical protein